MRRLIRKILIKLGLVKPKIGWKFYGRYARLTDDFIVRGDHVRILED